MYNSHILSLADAPVYSGLRECSVRQLLTKHQIGILQLFGTEVVSRRQFDVALAAELITTQKSLAESEPPFPGPSS